MTSILAPLKAFPADITRAAFHVATWANIAIAVSILGQLAQVVSNNSPVLNTMFGQQRGTFVATIALGISQAATTFAAHGEPVSGSVAASPQPVFVDNSIKTTNMQEPTTLGA